MFLENLAREEFGVVVPGVAEEIFRVVGRHDNGRALTRKVDHDVAHFLDQLGDQGRGRPSRGAWASLLNLKTTRLQDLLRLIPKADRFIRSEPRLHLSAPSHVGLAREADERIADGAGYPEWQRRSHLKPCHLRRCCQIA